MECSVVKMASSFAVNLSEEDIPGGRNPFIYLLQFNGKKMYINNESHKDSLRKSRGTPYKAGHLP